MREGKHAGYLSFFVHANGAMLDPSSTPAQQSGTVATTTATLVRRSKVATFLSQNDRASIARVCGAGRVPSGPRPPERRNHVGDLGLIIRIGWTTEPGTFPQVRP